jgi:RecA-family ATPase
MNPSPVGMSAPDLHIVSFDRSHDDSPSEVNWLWHGYLAPGKMTLLVIQWKAGKTTLVSVLLARMATGDPLAGLPVRAGRAVVVSEEAAEHWGERHAELNFGPDVGFLCRPFRRRPTPAEWDALIDHLIARYTEQALDLVVIDPLASFLPARTENHAGTMLAALLPLQRLTTRGISVLVLHHPRKGESAPGRAARGRGALAGSEFSHGRT